jgi:hypothetical protein
VELGDRADQAEAKAVARRRAAAFSTIEAVGQTRQVGPRNARSVILDRETRAGFETAFQADIDAGSGGVPMRSSM